MKKPKLIYVILLDVLLTAALLSGWLLWKSIAADLARKEYYQRMAETSAAPLEQEHTAAVPEELPLPEAEPVSEAAEPAAETQDGGETTSESAAEPDTRTEWQIRFADHFSEETVCDAHVYKSPNVSVTVTDGVFVSDDGESTNYYVADIYVASLDCFRTAFAEGMDYPYVTGHMPTMAEQSGAVLAINGDYCAFSYGGVVIRNGSQIMNWPNGSDICVLLRDGTMRCMSSEEYAAAAIPLEEQYQAWTFGPILLDENGMARPASELKHKAGASVTARNPRTAIGYYEPGHYCFFVSDGRYENNVGLTLDEMAEIFEELGCRTAYNLDGGGSSMMYLNGAFSNIPQSDGARDIPDIILITDTAPDSLNEELSAESEEAEQ